MIKDVSKQWAALLESKEEDDKAYAEACTEACNEMDKANEAEIDEYDEEIIDPSSCGFAEDEIVSEEDKIVSEVVDALDMWKTLKKDKDPDKIETVKVDNNYINTMKKLLSSIKISKSQLYQQAMDNLEKYKAAGLELPSPAQYAENFVPFETISKVLSGRANTDVEDNLDGSPSVDVELNRDDVEDDEIDGREYATDRRGAEYKDTAGAFGNDMADQNLYDSELTEAEEEEEEEEAQKKANDALEQAKKEIKGAYSEEEVEEWLDKNKAKMEEICSKLKNGKEELAENIKKLMKVLEKYSKGQLEESQKLDEKNGKSTPIGQCVKGILRFANWLLRIVPLGIIGSAWVIKQIGKGADILNQKIDKGLAESIALECANDAQALVDEAACNNQDDPATHLLDAVGVKASTASLKGENVAMLGIVESLLKKIDRLEARLDEAKMPDLSKKQGSITQLFIANKDAVDNTKTPQEITDIVQKIFTDNNLDTPASRRMLNGFQRSKSWINSLQYFYNIISKGSGFGMQEAEEGENETYDDVQQYFDQNSDKIKNAIDDIQDQDTKMRLKKFIDVIQNLGKNEEVELDDLGMSTEERKNFEKAKAIINASYSRRLTKAEENKFRDILSKLSTNAKERLLTIERAGYQRPGNVPPVANPTVYSDDGHGHYDGSSVQIPPFNYKQGSHQVTAAEKRKKAKEEFAKQQAMDTPIDQIAFPKVGDDTWEVTAVNQLMGSLSKNQRQEFIDGMIADIEAENKAVKDSGQLNAEELKELEAINAEEKAFIKSIMTHQQIPTRELAPIFGISHAGVSKAARKTLQIIKDAFKETIGKNIDVEKNPQAFADACEDMTDAEWTKFKALLKVKSEGRVNKKFMQGNDKEKKQALRDKINAVKAQLASKKSAESPIPEEEFMGEACKKEDKEDKETK